VLRILVDGIDLTGKTTTAKAFAEIVGARYNSGPIHKGPAGKLADRIVASPAPQITKGATSTLAYILDRPALSLMSEILIQDRYWPSLLAYAQVAYPWPIPNISAALFARCPRFDVNILLAARCDALVERYKERDRKDRIETRLVRDPEFEERYERALREIMQGLGNFREFDTSNSMPEETAHEIAAWLRESNLLPSA
jgi:thymidylate kinase